jgi:hypothetical protein
MALAAALLVGLAPLPAFSQAPQATPTRHKNFKVALYVVVNATRRLADPAAFEREYERAQRQIGFDKVYIEVYRDRQFATDAEVAAVKAQFQAKGIEVSGGVTPAAGGSRGQFGTFDYELAADRAECIRAITIAARHFDEVILDDFFFYTSKSDADIAARGEKSWTQYRLEAMRKASRDLILGPAKAANPNVRVIIKYPNWYEHFQALGYDLEQQSQMFDAIYTGTETRDPDITDQFLQQYESYLVYRYYSAIRPGKNLGGWVDTFSTRYVDRYAEQLWDTLFAKAPEITLFSWHPVGMGEAIQPGARPWSGQKTSFDWDEMVREYRPGGAGDPGPGWGAAAGYSLREVDKVLGALGKPTGLAAYKPYHSTGEDFLHNYLGNIGLPIDLRPDFPTDAATVLLTESAKADPRIIDKIEAQLKRGGNVVVTSGFVQAMQDKGFKRLVEVEATGRVAPISQYVDGFGAGNGASLNDAGVASPPVLFPELRFMTNDAWSIIRGVAGSKGYPIVLMNRYSRGIIYIVTLPENPADLYNLPVALTSRIKAYIGEAAPVRIEAEPKVAVFTYDNGALVLRNYRDTSATVTVSLAAPTAALRDVASGEVVPVEPKSPRATTRFAEPEDTRSTFKITVPAHSFRAFAGPGGA